MHISYLSIVVAALVQWGLGILWYGVIVKKSWRKLIGLAEGEKPQHGIFTLASGLVACLLLSYIMAHFFAITGVRNFTDGFAIGIACWLRRSDQYSAAQNGLLASILIYNVAAAAILTYTGYGGLVGIALWPAILVHSALAVWCVACLCVKPGSSPT